MSSAGSTPSSRERLSSSRRSIRTSGAPAAIGPYSQGIQTGDLLFTAGQLGLEPSTGQLVGGGVAAEARQALANISAIAEAAGASIATSVKTTIYLTDMADFRTVNDVYATFFEDDPPARTTVAVATLPLSGRVLIEAVIPIGR